MTLKEIKIANPDFFSQKCEEFFGDAQMIIAREGQRHVLRVLSSHGTKPVYAIDPQTKQLSYLRHDCEPVPANGPQVQH